MERCSGTLVSLKVLVTLVKAGGFMIQHKQPLKPAPSHQHQVHVTAALVHATELRWKRDAYCHLVDSPVTTPSTSPYFSYNVNIYNTKCE